MNDYQKILLAKIEKIKESLRTDGPFFFENGNPATRAQIVSKLNQMAHTLASYDDVTPDVRKAQFSDAGGRSRSPAFGKWLGDDEPQDWKGP